MAQSRNSILSSIVLAAGGTVTNPNNRNRLLQDWLDAISTPVMLSYYAPTKANIPNIVYSDSFRLELEVALNSDITTEQWVYSDWDSSRNNIAVRIKNGNWECFTVGASGQNIFTIPAISDSVNGLVLEFTLSTTAFGANGLTVSKNSKGSFADANIPIYIGQRDGVSSNLGGFVTNIKYFDYTNNALSRDYDFSGAESILLDLLNGHDGTVTSGVLGTYVVNYPLLEGVDNTNVYTILTPEGSTLARLLIGQSNTVSRAASVAGIDDDYTDVIGRVNQFGVLTNTLKSATNPLEHHDATPTSAGFWLEMSKNTNGKQLMIPTAKGATGLANNDWNQGDPYYRQCRDTANEAMASSVNTSLDYVLMIMGETDADLGNTSYGADLLAMRQGMISDIGAMSDSTVWVVVEISGSTTPANVGMINTQLALFASSIPNGVVIPNTDLVITDTWHYDMPSQRLIGQRIADVINS
jgi:hypothetical protein